MVAHAFDEPVVGDADLGQRLGRHGCLGEQGEQEVLSPNPPMIQPTRLLERLLGQVGHGCTAKTIIAPVDWFDTVASTLGNGTWTLWGTGEKPVTADRQGSC